MANNFRLEFAARTDTGRVRLQNEDCVVISPSYGFAVLADGMGGYSAGEVASSMAVEVVKNMLEQELASRDGIAHTLHRAIHRSLSQLLDDAIQAANAAILNAARAEPRHAGMGTTIVVAVLAHDIITIAHVGDSRAYRMRQDELVQLTRDHSLLQEQIDAGLIHPEWARYAQNKNLVTRAVGVSSEVEVEINTFQTQAGDVYLLCSDGLSDMLTQEEIRRILSDRSASLQRTCDILVEQANESGGYDNISVAAIRNQQAIVDEDASFIARIWNWIS